MNGSAVNGAYRLENMVSNSVKGLSVFGQAMNFYWQHTPQVKDLNPRPPALLGAHSVQAKVPCGSRQFEYSPGWGLCVSVMHSFRWILGSCPVEGIALRARWGLHRISISQCIGGFW